MTHADLGRATHFWLSHEHPDHFSPLDLRQVPEAARANICVLYRRTKDRRVVEFCAKLGFKVDELDPGVWLELEEGVSIQMGPVL